MTDFIKSNPKLDAAIAGSNNFEAMREAVLSTLAAQGVLVRSRTDAYDVRVVPQEPTPEASSLSVSVSPVAATHMRTIYPSGNNRFELYGTSEAELDEKESQIRRMFGRQQ